RPLPITMQNALGGQVDRAKQLGRCGRVPLTVWQQYSTTEHINYEPIGAVVAPCVRHFIEIIRRHYKYRTLTWQPINVSSHVGPVARYVHVCRWQNRPIIGYHCTCIQRETEGEA